MHAVSILVHSPGKRPHAMARLPPGTSRLEAVMYSVILFFYFFFYLNKYSSNCWYIVKTENSLL